VDVVQAIDDCAVRRRDEAVRLMLAEIDDVHVVQRQRRHAVLVDVRMRQHLERVSDLDRVRVGLFLLLLRLRLVAVVIAAAAITCRKQSGPD